MEGQKPVEGDWLSRVLDLPGGRRIGYAELGDPNGLPVIALHGTPGSRLMFALTDQAARERGLRIIAPERPGYGLSTYRRSHSLMSLATDVESVADALGFDRFALLGVSGGGPHAVAASSLMPERIVLLALIGPVGPIAECRGRIRLSKLHRFIFTGMGQSPQACGAFFLTLRNLARLAPGVAYRGLLQRVTPSDRVILQRPEVRASLQAAIREGLRPGIKGAVQDLRLSCAPWGLKLADIDVPAVIWQGSDDTIVPASAAYYLAQELPHSRLDVIQGAGHYWVFGQFGMVLETVKAALESA